MGNTNLKIATVENLAAIEGLCRTVVGSEFCTWNAFYPIKEDWMFDINHQHLFLLEEEGIPVAVGAIVTENELDELEGWTQYEETCEFARIATARHKQNQGYAKKLLQEMIKIAEAQGKRAVHLLAACQNLPARKLYQSLGFSVCGECEMYGNRYFRMELQL